MFSDGKDLLQTMKTLHLLPRMSKEAAAWKVREALPRHVKSIDVQVLQV